MSKTEEMIIPKENIGSVVKVGDLSPVPLDHLSNAVDDLNFLLEHVENFTEWPSVVSADIASQVHSMKSEVYEVSGSFRGRTLLPMPSGVSNSENDIIKTADVMYKIESIVIKWTHQVRSVLDQSSAQALLDGKNPGPNVSDIAFDWKLFDT